MPQAAQAENADILQKDTIARHETACYGLAMEKQITPLKAWLKATGRKAVWLSEQLGVSAQTVSAYASGRLQPSQPMKLAIQAVTNGEVTPDQWGGK
jgi:DNA-binding transcriptional regulator YiaG